MRLLAKRRRRRLALLRPAPTPLFDANPPLTTLFLTSSPPLQSHISIFEQLLPIPTNLNPSLGGISLAFSFDFFNKLIWRLGEQLHACVGCNSTGATAVETLDPALIVGQPGSDPCCTSDVTQGGGGPNGCMCSFHQLNSS